jgi:hypothetical protein
MRSRECLTKGVGSEEQGAGSGRVAPHAGVWIEPVDRVDVADRVDGHQGVGPQDNEWDSLIGSGRG